MIDWIKATVGIDLVLLNVAYVIVLISYALREFSKPDSYNRSQPEYKNHYQRRGWVAIVLNVLVLFWLFMLPLTIGFYRNMVVFYARINYSESQELCNELKEYGYVCKEFQAQSEQTKK
jgi:NADH:ubiquinone oxidoreductase subunit 2 (subunit N)